MMKKVIFVVILIVTLLTLVGCKAKKAESSADLIDLGAQPSSQTVEAYGVIQTDIIKDVMIDFPAVVEKVDVKNGQKVAAGDTLMELNIDDFNSQLQQQESDINIQKEQLKQQREQLNEQKKQDGLTKDAKSQIEDQENLLKEQEAKLSAQEDSLALQKAKLKQANFNQNLVTSDIANGVVFNIWNVAGDMVSSGYKLISIADMNSLKVTANIDQQFISWVKVGSEVEITPEYDKDTVIKGTVSYISSITTINNGETDVPIEITIDDKAENLILNADVQVKILPAQQQ